MSRTTRWLVLLAILLSAVGLRLWRITSLPPGFYLDESFEGLAAWRILTDPTYHPIFLSGNGNPLALNAYLNALMFGLFRLFGGEAGPVAMRVTAACLGVFGVAALYGLASELQKLIGARLSIWFPFFAAASLAFMRWHIHFSRTGIEPILVPLIWTSALWLLLRSWRTGGWLSWMGCGVMVAASMYAYQAAWVIPFLMAPSTLLLWQQTESGTVTFSLWQWRSRFSLANKHQLVGLAVTALVALLLLLPFIRYTWHNSDIVLLRTSQVAANVGTDSAPTSTIWSGIKHTALMYSPFGAPGDQSPRRNIPGEPVLNLWQALLFFAGLGVALWRWRHPAYAIVLLGLIGLLLPGALSNHAPHFHRTLGAAAPTALLCGFGLDWIWQWRAQQTTANRSWSAVTRQLGWVSLLLLVLGGATSVQDYFVRWAVLPRLDYAFDTGLWQVGEQLKQLPPEQPVYLTPIDSSYPTLAFALLNHPNHAPVSFDGRHILPLTAKVSAQPELYAVIEDEDPRTHLLLPEVFPTLTIQQEIHDWQGDVYARFYVRPANAVPQRPPQYPKTASLGDGIQVLGYDYHPETVHPGETLYLQIHWLVETQPTANWTVFTHLLAKDAAGNLKLVAGKDNPPGENTLPTERWQPGWRILDEYQIQLPADIALGEYALEIGLYQASGEHLPSQGTGVSMGPVVIK
ncbi:hypothetical protein BH10CHL1_BH10CHL1_25140 [soil metagenome]